VLNYPAAVDSVVSVGSVGILHQRAAYSNYGLNEAGKLMDIVGPGGDPTSEGEASWVRQESYASCARANQSFQSFHLTFCTGTSMAAAHVSGVAALIRSAFPNLSSGQVRSTLRRCAQDLGIPGQDEQFGFGLVQADASLEDTDSDDLPDCIDSNPFTPTPTPPPPPSECAQASATPTPGPTTPAPTATLTEAPTPAPSGTVTVESVSTATPTPTEQTAPTDSPAVTETPSPSPSPTATLTPTPTESPTASPTESPVVTETPTPTPTPAATPTATTVPKCGDVDCSGEVDGADSLGILRWFAKVPPYAVCLGRGHVNSDQDLNALDAVLVLRFSAGLSVNVPEGCAGVG
jgi:subtilisin family serine protease